MDDEDTLDVLMAQLRRSVAVIREAHEKSAAQRETDRLDLATDFSTIGPDGLLWAQLNWFSARADLRVGARLIVCGPGDIRRSVVVERHEGDWVGMRLDEMGR